MFRDAIAHESIPVSKPECARLAALLQNPRLTPEQRERVREIAIKFLRRGRGLEGRLLAKDARTIARLEEGAPDLGPFLASPFAQVGAEYRGSRADLYRAYRAQCLEDRSTPASPQAFGQALAQTFGPPASWGGTPMFRGLRASTSAPAESDPELAQALAAIAVEDVDGRVTTGELYRAYARYAGAASVSRAAWRTYVAARFRPCAVRGGPGWRGIALKPEATVAESRGS